MADIRWTPEQQRAIETRGRHLLVSAAAGSGKTAVLVERIVRRITVEGGDIDRLLIVTFTDPAATQMRDRLVQALDDRLVATPGDAHLLRQLMLLPGASISTLHSFCLAVVRQHFYRLGLDPSFRVMDDHEAQLLRLETLEVVLESAYERMQPDDAFARLVTAYGGGRGDEALQRFILNVHDYSRSLPDPHGWLRESVAAYARLDAETFADGPWAAELKLFVDIQLAQAERLLRRALVLAEGPGGAAAHAQSLTEDVERIGELRAAVGESWSELIASAPLADFPRLKSARGDDVDPDVRRAVTHLRNTAKKLVEEQVRDKLLSRPLVDEMNALRQLAPQMDVLMQTVIEFDEAYTAAKNERGLVDFGDIEHLCLALLDEPAVAQEVRERFDEVLIDECQDLNGVQDTILQRIARPADGGGELFLVGDVKQSVYRFRQADPGLFLGRYERASDDETDPEQRIDLQANFRSRGSIIGAVNFLFRQLMTEAAAEMDYGPEAELVAGAHFGPEVEDPPVELHVLERERKLLVGDGADSDGADAEAADDRGHADSSAAAYDSANVEDDLSAFQREALYAAEHIERLIREEQAPVWDNRLGRYRPARYGDVVILMRAMSNRANELMDVLSGVGVPAYAELGKGYFAATEVETMLALLSVLDNPRQDIPLAAVLRSVIVGVSPADMARIRLCSPSGDLFDAVLAAAEDDDLGPLQRQMQQFLAKIDEWRTLSRRAPLSKLVWSLLAETRYFDYAGALPGGRQRQANLRALYERARQFNHFARHGLSRFLRFIERLRDSEGDLGTAPALGEADDVVRIMSVHKSKGLEFPIVFVLDAGRGFMRRGGHPDLAFQRDLGLGAGLVDGGRRIAQPSLLQQAVTWRRQREELAEEMRVLYVALTRARDRLIIIGSGSNIDNLAADWAEAASYDGWSLADERLLMAGSWLEWIGPAVMRHNAGAPLRERVDNDVRLADATVAADESPWQVYVGGRASLSSAPEEVDVPPIPWGAVAMLQPLHPLQPPAHAEADAEAYAEARAGAETEAHAKVHAEAQTEAHAKAETDLALDEAAAAIELYPEVESEHGAGVGIDDPVPDSVRGELQRRIDWNYPWAPLVGQAAKQSVSELKRRWDAIGMEESEPVSSFRRRLDDRPAFLQAAGRPLTAAERGSAVHLVLQHIDLTATLDRTGLETQLQRLVQREMLTPEQADAVPLNDLERFFATALGKRLQRQAEHVQREVPFTMALPAAKAYLDLDPDLAHGEVVVVQGIIDCLVPGANGPLLLDFKTDQVSAAGVDTAASHYEGQVRLYKQAVEHMYGQAVQEAYLVFLAAGEAVLIHG